MLRGIVESIANWTWLTRIVFASLLILISIAFHVYFERIWLWGYAISGFILLSGFLFQEKHVEFQEEDAEELVANTYCLTYDALKDLMSFFAKIAIKGLNTEKYNSLIQQIANMNEEQIKLFNYYITTTQTASSISIKIQKDLDKYKVVITTNDTISQMMSKFSENVE